MGPVGEKELPADRHAPLFEAVDLADHARRVENDAAGDDTGDVVPENPAGNERQLPGLTAGDDRVAGVGPPLVADDKVVLLGEEIDELPLRFVTPLQTDDAGAGHGRGSSGGGLERRETANPPEAAAARSTRCRV